MDRRVASVVIGIVGYSPVLDRYPLGPRLMRALERGPWPDCEVAVENMTWGPVHIVQRYQDEGFPGDRLVLVGAAAEASVPGQITCTRWHGGKIDEAAMQERMYEAVTGIVSLENTLVIGDHFGIWPDEVFTVEIDMKESTFGDLVISEAGPEYAVARSNRELAEDIGFDVEDAIDRLAAAARDVALHGPRASATLIPRTSGRLAPTRPFAQTDVLRAP